MRMTPGPTTCDEFANQELFDKAIEQYCQADELWQKKESPARINALWGWG
jgi:hypothetical protein